ncbi:MAG: hypothetical protein EZS28_024730 [Streblomastix strix]|uniref:Reverse transcriptase domain-containing protein n=1 Tax=Streblomastix strix TaxID=222440 RepID=A0A5J4VB35_9EUKA|nr:MAG: hypothetical protein EZS28_024730 [Streblomastix strix]
MKDQDEEAGCQGQGFTDHAKDVRLAVYRDHGSTDTAYKIVVNSVHERTLKQVQFRTTHSRILIFTRVRSGKKLGNLSQNKLMSCFNTSNWPFCLQKRSIHVYDSGSQYRRISGHLNQLLTRRTPKSKEHTNLKVDSVTSQTRGKNVQNLRPILKPDDQMIKIDLESAYHHIQVNKELRPFLCFPFNQKSFFNKAMRIGLNMAN